MTDERPEYSEVENQLENIATNLSTVVPTLQMVIEALPPTCGELDDVLALCRNHLEDNEKMLLTLADRMRKSKDA